MENSPPKDNRQRLRTNLDSLHGGERKREERAEDKQGGAGSAFPVPLEGDEQRTQYMAFEEKRPVGLMEKISGQNYKEAVIRKNRGADTHMRITMENGTSTRVRLEEARVDQRMESIQADFG
ncbi:hypothetical protein AX774_g2461 [Zancudomyces culisetae]|uniref:Uncharacterized protein n=1 Tax=Zancudomyces culisetae TaxID=1213189 RepID=A0A1R1PSU0_ZANCU|nr:hypothetical protein AX774_g2461 [Zancudomyces culisetae]|eukprot:OMH84028.1 hypothetical protein AX774_g2461 [Zancudomyces culisetae]